MSEKRVSEYISKKCERMKTKRIGAPGSEVVEFKKGIMDVIIADAVDPRLALTLVTVDKRRALGDGLLLSSSCLIE